MQTTSPTDNAPNDVPGGTPINLSRKVRRTLAGAMRRARRQAKRAMVRKAKRGA